MFGIDEIESVHYQLTPTSAQQVARSLYARQLRRVILSILPIGAVLIAASVELAVVLPTLGNVALGVALGVYTGLFAALSGGVIMGALPGIVLAIMSGTAYALVQGFLGGLEFGLALLFTLFRLPQYLFESCAQISLYFMQTRLGRSTLDRVPVLFHELSYFPHPLLEEHIVRSAPLADLSVIRKVLDACAIAPGQRRAGRRALARLQALDLRTLAENNRFGLVVDLESKWLPGVQGASPVLLTFRELGRYLAAAQSSSNPYYQLSHIERARKLLVSLKNQLLSEKPYVVDALASTYDTWQSITESLYVIAKAAAAGTIPNPFRADAPLTPELGSEVFRGREQAIERVRALLVDPTKSYSIAILGPRRFGKTSLLRMLGELVPDAIFVFFDLQGNPIDSPEAFFRALAAQTIEQSRRDRRVSLPNFPAGGVFEAATRWIDVLEESLGNSRLVLCIDEFERLEALFPGSHKQLLQLMGLFRAIIQHKRKVRILVAGAAPFDELTNVWNDHFINVQEVKLGPLDLTSARGLLMKPAEGFPEDAISVAVADAIIGRTGSQPFLMQLYGSGLVATLNDEKRSCAELRDVEVVERSILDEGQAPNYFRTIFYEAPLDAQQILVETANGMTPALDGRGATWLRRRYLLTDHGALGIPVLGEWIKGEIEVAGRP